MTILFSLTLFLSACLLFLIQPMVGKMLLPTLGGAYSVWNTCMVFFQALLLGGYLYSHLALKFLGPRRHSAIHIGLLLLPLLVLPIAISSELASTAPGGSDPTLWLLGVLFLTAGLPFFVVSTSAPVFQKWFSSTTHKFAADPYFLYAASNAGSVAGLLLYPLVFERYTTVAEQARIWQFGYIALVVLAAACAVVMWRHGVANGPKARQKATEILSKATGVLSQSAEPLTMKRRLFWVLLAFIPSSLMLGVTTYITTDLASVPLLWILPLALYLLSFIFVYARKPIYAPWWLGRGMCLIAAALMVAFIVEMTHPPALILTMHVALFFVAALVAHGRLAKDRPDTAHLTEYFLLISVGGVLGGIFNALIAPLLFTHIYEYVLVIALACAVREAGPKESQEQSWRRALIVYALIVVSIAAIIFVVEHFQLGVDPSLAIVAFGFPAVLACSQIENPRFFAGALLVMLAAGSFYTGHHQRPIFFERNFYGNLRVADDLDGNMRLLIDGNTVHGRQHISDDEECAPLSYYYPSGPAGLAFRAYQERQRSPEDTSNIALLGMGIGSLACYGTAAEHWDLYELNPLVIEVATNPRYFSILDRATLGSYEIIAGDGRLRIQRVPDGHYDILVVDAFSSGSIPVHLITRQAVELYLQKLSASGLLLFHISNRILNLEPILADIAAALDIPGYVVVDDYVSDAEALDGKDPSVWVFLAADEASLDFVARRGAARRLEGNAEAREWTDSYSNILAPLLSGQTGP